jgi:diguanylate cyclase (GGDEF)-like protein
MAEIKSVRRGGAAEKSLRDLGYYNEQLHLQSMRDDLTQLYNRRGFMKMGNDCYENAKKNVQGLLLLYVDLDDLKKINDQYGHNEGDYAIAQAAEILNKTFRSSDIICRLGGDEFTILIEDASLADEGEIRRRIQHYCDLHNAASQKPYQLSMSMGAAAYTPDSDKTFEMLMKEADLALYEEKQRKHGKTQCFE